MNLFIHPSMHLVFMLNNLILNGFLLSSINISSRVGGDIGKNGRFDM